MNTPEVNLPAPNFPTGVCPIAAPGRAAVIGNWLRAPVIPIESQKKGTLVKAWQKLKCSDTLEESFLARFVKWRNVGVSLGDAADGFLRKYSNESESSKILPPKSLLPSRCLASRFATLWPKPKPSQLGISKENLAKVCSAQGHREFQPSTGFIPFLQPHGQGRQNTWNEWIAFEIIHFGFENSNCFFHSSHVRKNSSIVEPNVDIGGT
jgi:hypothetical protein